MPPRKVKITVFFTDNQVVGESESTLLTVKGVTQFNIILKMIQVEADYAQVQIVGNASGGAILEISAQAEVNRTSGGSNTILPI